MSQMTSSSGKGPPPELGVNFDGVLQPKDMTDDNNTYVVILKQEDDPGHQNMSSLNHSDQAGNRTKEFQKNVYFENHPFASKSFAKHREDRDDIRLNLTHGFDSYDSSSSSLRVFDDEKDSSASMTDEGYGGTYKQETKFVKPHFAYIPKISAQREFSPSGGFYMYKTDDGNFLSTEPDWNTELSSGYISADAATHAVGESFETPSSQVSSLKHPASRQIFVQSTPIAETQGSDVRKVVIPSHLQGKQHTVDVTPIVTPASFSVAKSSYLTSTPNTGVIIQSGRNSYLVPNSSLPNPFNDTLDIVPDIEYQTPSGSKVTLSKSIPQLVNTCKFRGKNKGIFPQSDLIDSTTKVVVINPDDSKSKKNEDSKELHVSVDDAFKRKSPEAEASKAKSGGHQIVYQKSSRVGDVVVHVRVENNSSSVEVGSVEAGTCESKKQENREIRIAPLQDVTNSNNLRPSFCVRNCRSLAPHSEISQTLDLPTFNVENLPMMQGQTFPYSSLLYNKAGECLNASQSHSSYKTDNINYKQAKGSMKLPCKSSASHSTSKAVTSDLQNGNYGNSLKCSQESVISACSSQDSQSESSQKDEMNDSLTSMQWLDGIKLKPDKERGDTTNTKKDAVIQWRHLSQEDILQIANEYGRVKRPPFSYMTLIQMALLSREDKRMTLREICKWIEETFPYYKHTAKSGWKNSIRHNLSLYSIFEREQSKKHGSHWTIREDGEGKVKVPAPKKTECMSPLPSCLPVTFIPQQTSTTPKLPLPSTSGLQPILPRPDQYSTPLQTYALIPIQSLSSGATQSSPSIPDISSQSSQEGAKAPILSKRKSKKNCAIAPKVSKQSLLRQAWLNAQSVISDSDTERTNGVRDLYRGSEKDQQSDENICTKRSKTVGGLPKPRLYSKKTPPRRGKTRRKQKLIPKERELMQDTSDEEVDFIASIEKDVPTNKSKSVDSANEVVSTSTPFKSKLLQSPQLPSPIRGCTPLKTPNLLDNSLLDCIKDSDSESIRNFLGSPNLLFNRKVSPSHMRSPNMSQVEMLFSGLTPIKGDQDHENNHNLSQILAELDEEGLPTNLANISWNSLCQNINPENPDQEHTE